MLPYQTQGNNFNKEAISQTAPTAHATRDMALGGGAFSSYKMHLQFLP
jgi:hypothetical protein